MSADGDWKIGGRACQRPPVDYRRWFWNAYDEVTRIKDSDVSGEMTVLRRKPGGELPPAQPPGVGKWNRGK